MKDGRSFRLCLVHSLTMGRVPLILVFLIIVVFVPKPLGAFWFAAAIGAMILSAVTDLLDGYLARKLGVVTRLGAYADPLTDKVFYLTAFPSLVYLAGLQGQEGHARLLLIVTVLFLMRDHWVSFLRSIGAMYDVDAKANWSGKVRTIVSFPAVCMIFYYLQVPRDWPIQIGIGIVYVLEIVCMAINLISMWVYTVYYWPWLRKEITMVDDKKV